MAQLLECSLSQFEVSSDPRNYLVYFAIRLLLQKSEYFIHFSVEAIRHIVITEMLFKTASKSLKYCLNQKVEEV